MLCEGHQCYGSEKSGIRQGVMTAEIFTVVLNCRHFVCVVHGNVESKPVPVRLEVEGEVILLEIRTHGVLKIIADDDEVGFCDFT
jgi:hypothetical protein